ncbi:hypothetical protein P3S59_25780, partial [Enterobacter hormaechei]|uniref:hypothetical protein n=1 Tax=Enterobacter hormaechei TaxID=158836 RepID=UPI0023E37B37
LQRCCTLFQPMDEHVGTRWLNLFIPKNILWNTDRLISHQFLPAVQNNSKTITRTCSTQL